MNNFRAPHLSRAATPWRILLPLLLALYALSADAAGPGMAPCGDHPWLKLPPPTLDAEEPAPLYLEVKPALRAQAVQLLEDRMVMRVTPEQAERYTGEPAESWVPGLTFLLRGVRNPDKDSRYAVSFAFGGEVIVHYAGRRPGKPYSAPMVAVLEQPPAALYVTCMAGQ
jgi:hypothetical protein